MAVIKPTRSGKGVLFIDDGGNAFITSVAYLKAMLENPKPTKFIQPNRLPFLVSRDRFKPSPMFDPETGEVHQVDSKSYRERNENVTVETDAVSKKATKDIDETLQYKDKKVF